MSQFDRLPDEIVQEILGHAMIRGTPFSIGDCLRTAIAVDSSTKSNKARSQPADNACFFDMSSVAFSSDELRESYFDERDTRRSRLTNREICTSQWPLYDASIDIQRPHLLDWRIAGSVCKRFRGLGKEAFFSKKVFALDFDLAKRLQELEISRISTQDQQTALKYISSIILIYRNVHSPSALITLPRRIAAFLSLKCLDLFFGGRDNEPLAWMIKAVKDRIQPSSHFVDALTTIGLPVKKLAIGIMHNPDSTWSFYESLLEKNFYPLLKAWMTVKAGIE